MGRPKIIQEPEFIDLWKKTNGNLMDMARMLRPEDPKSIYRSLLRMKESLEAQGKLISKAEIKPSEIAPLIDDFDQIIEVIEWKKYMFAKNLSERTIENRIQILRSMWRRLNKKRPMTFNIQDVLDQMARMREEGKKNLFSFVSTMRNWFKFLTYKDYLDGNTLQKYLNELGTKGLKGEPIIVYLERDEFDKLVNALQSLFDDDYYKKLVKAMAWVKVTTGIRTGDPIKKRELLGLQLSQMRIIGNQVIFDGVFAKKKEIWNDVRPSPKACEYLLDYLNYRKKLGIESEYVFCKPNGNPISPKQFTLWFRKAKAIANLKKPCHPHVLRKTYLSWMVASGVPLEVAIDLNVGWKDIATAQKYYLTILNRNKEKSLNDLWSTQAL